MLLREGGAQAHTAASCGPSPPAQDYTSGAMLPQLPLGICCWGPLPPVAQSRLEPTGGSSQVPGQHQAPSDGAGRALSQQAACVAWVPGLLRACVGPDRCWGVPWREITASEVSRNLLSSPTPLLLHRWLWSTFILSSCSGGSWEGPWGSHSESLLSSHQVGSWGMPIGTA